MSSALPHLEFFFDRSLGKETARQLRALGWTVHLIADAYPNDAQDIDDEIWIAEGCSRGWVLLTKDKKIRYRGRELAAMHDGRLFCLSRGDLVIAQMVQRLGAARASIQRHASPETLGFWIVYESGRVVRRWP